MAKWLVGVDEAGRGPLAGPVTIGVVKVPINFNWQLLPEVADSKQLTEVKRGVVFENLRRLQQVGKIDCTVTKVHASTIDTIGITSAVKLGINRAFERLELNESECLVKLDGLLSAPSRFLNQETIIKGDQKEPVIGLASIAAKVTRDRYMIARSTDQRFTAYQFHLHKGYGTALHRKLIAKHNLSSLHRRSYCKNINLL